MIEIFISIILISAACLIILLLLALLDRFSEGIYFSGRKTIENWDFLIKKWAEEIKEKEELREVVVGSTKIYFEKNWITGTLLKSRRTMDSIHIKPSVEFPPGAAHIAIILIIIIPPIGAIIGIYGYFKGSNLKKRIMESLESEIKEFSESGYKIA
jgi:hypothetical protein